MQQELKKVIDPIAAEFRSYAFILKMETAQQAAFYSYQNLALTSHALGVTENKRNPKIIVSLTSYGERIWDVHLVIESLFRQTLKADEIVLWLAETEFDNDNIPEILKQMKTRGLTIRFCKDYRSYKKLVFSLKEFPNDILITVDDDVFYRIDTIERLFQSYQKYPENIHAMRARQITFDSRNKPVTYFKWPYVEKVPFPTHMICPVGVGGVLYPPGCFDEEVFNHRAFLKLAPTVDDLWFAAMAVRNNVKKRKVGTRANADPVSIPGSQDQKLWDHNARSGNDDQIRAIFDHYKLWDKINSAYQKNNK